MHSTDNPSATDCKGDSDETDHHRLRLPNLPWGELQLRLPQRHAAAAGRARNRLPLRRRLHLPVRAGTVRVPLGRTTASMDRIS